MTRYDRRVRLLAVALAAQAGFVDALGFLNLGGYFVSFMSGNSTRAAVESNRDVGAASIAGGLIALFVGGVMAGSLVRRTTRTHPITVVQVFVVACLVAAALAHARSRDIVAVAIMTIAMGAENAAFERDGEAGIGVTYVTGALVKAGQLVVRALLGGDRVAWVWPALLWLGLVVGGVAGAIAYGAFALDGLWLVVAAGTLLAAVSYVIERALSADR